MVNYLTYLKTAIIIVVWFMKISVIIPVYNRQNLIKRAVDSVLRQTEKPWEIIVINDGSTDDTIEILEEYEELIHLITQNHSGVSAARNRGIKAALGDWIALLDSDDEWLPVKLQNAARFHHRFPEFKIFQSEELWVRNGRRVNPRKKHQKLSGWIFRQSLPLCIVSPSAVLIEKELFREVGYFDESFPVCEDYDLWLRATRKYPIGLDANFDLIKYGGHQDQLSKKYWGMDSYRIKAMEKHLMDPALPSEQRMWILEEAIRKLDILIRGYQKRSKNVSILKSKRDQFQKELSSIFI